MSRDINGNYTLPSGNPVAPGTLIESAWANSTMDDLAASMTDSLSRSGLGGMLAPFYNASGAISAPGMSWTNEPTSGWYRKALNEFWYSVGGADIFGISSAGIILAPGRSFAGLSTLSSALQINNTLGVLGLSTLTGGLHAIGAALFDALATFGAGIDVNGGNATFDAPAVFNSTLEINGPVDAGGTGTINYVLTAGGGVLPPVWAPAQGAAGTVTLDGVQTLTNKTITGLKETAVAMPANDINTLAGNYFTKTVAVDTTFTVSNISASPSASSIILELTNGGAHAITWWAGVKWASGTVPTLTAAGRDVLGFFNHDNSATWTGLVLAKDVK